MKIIDLEEDFEAIQCQQIKQIIKIGLFRDEFRSQFVKEYLHRYHDVVFLAAQILIDEIKEGKEPQAKIFEIVCMFPNFELMDKEEEGLFFDHDNSQNQKVFQQMIV